jgi:uncharacterized protein (DUF433 family)
VPGKGQNDRGLPETCRPLPGTFVLQSRCEVKNMTLAIKARPIPLQKDEAGTVWITGTRIPLDTIVYAYLNGDSAEEIVESFDTLNLSDVYAIISYYLDHQSEVDAYLQGRQVEAAALRNKIEKRFPSKGVRERLLARQKKHDQTGG